MDSSRAPWRLIPYDIGPSSRHFALSDALARLVSSPTVWWHSTDQPTVILGAGQKVPVLDSRASREAGIEVVKRQAGGTAVYAGPGVLGLDIALPSGHPLVLPDIVESYRWLGEVWAEALTTLGADVHLVSIAEARAAAGIGRPHSELIRLACFGSLSPYEVVAGHRKLVGLAQVRRRTATLFQSGVHLDFDAFGLARLLAPDAGAELAGTLADAAAGLRQVVPGPIDEIDMIEAFNGALQCRLGIALEPGNWTPEELAHVGAREATQV